MKKPKPRKKKKPSKRKTGVLPPGMMKVFLRHAAAAIIQNEILTALESGKDVTVRIGDREIHYEDGMCETRD